jgi:anti-sigma factor RsiW
MAKCTSIDPLVTPYVDGELPAAERTLVDEHLQRCPPCQSRVAAEAAIRDLLLAQKARLTSECASGALREHCRGLMNSGHGSSAESTAPLSRSRAIAPRRQPAMTSRTSRTLPGNTPLRTRMVPLALSASLLVLVGGAFLYLATDYSARLMAAELCADHMTCFAANNLLGTHELPEAVESSMLSSFDWRMHLPRELDASGLELVGARRCLYGEGRIAHLMYRDPHGRPLSIFMLPKSMRPAQLMEMLGHQVAIWSSGDRTFVLVSRASRDEVAQMATLVKGALQ